MFSPEYLDDLVKITEPASANFNTYLTNKVVESIVKAFEDYDELTIIPANKHKINVLRQSGVLLAEIEAEINKRLPGLNKKVREAFYQAGYDINDDINKAVESMLNSDSKMRSFVGNTPRLDKLTDDEVKILNAAYKRTNGQIRNLTKTTAGSANQQFINACDDAWWKMNHGIDANTAIMEAIDDVSKVGTHVVYSKNGKQRKMTVESAVRMCVITGINQANAEITLQTCADMGCRNVLVSSHIGARYTSDIEPANHQSWQGKVYSLSESLLKKYGYSDEPKKRNVFQKIKDFFGKFKKSETYEDFETVTGYGTITGFAGINCRHTMMPFLSGMENNQPQYDSEENKKRYDLSQKQRYYERKIRETKRRLFENRKAQKITKDKKRIEVLKAKEKKLKALFDKQYQEYTIFCKQNGLSRSDSRLYVSDRW